jgi:hypothetical protein
VAYVFLDAKQAKDQALVDSIRAQGASHSKVVLGGAHDRPRTGFGITIDASADDIAALTNGVLAR